MDSVRRLVRRLKQSTNPTHVAVYHRSDVQDGKTHHYFRFVLGQEGAFQTDVRLNEFTGQRLRRIHVEAIPDAFVESVQQYVRQRAPVAMIGEDAFHRYLGHVSLEDQKGIAETRSVYPRSEHKDELALRFGKQTPGWGAHLESLCIRQLEGKGVTHVKSGFYPSDPRRDVLEKAQLTYDTAFPIREWYTKLEAYFQKKLAEHRQKSVH